MARLTALPSLEIIRGLKGIIDFYLWKGLPCARAWPRWRPARQSEASKAAALFFGAVVKSYSLLGDLPLAAYRQDAADQPRSARDVFVSGIYGNLHEADVSDFLGLLIECRDFLSALTAILNALHDVGLDELDTNVLSSALPAGAATQTTLATLSTEAKLETVRVLLASLDAKDFSTDAGLAALFAELQLKADLTETQPVSAAALPLPAGAATAAHQVTQNVYLRYLENLYNALQSAKLDRLLVRGMDQLFSFKGQVKGEAGHTMVGDGTYTLLGPAVDPGEVWVLNTLFGRTWYSTVSALYLGFDTSGTLTWGAGQGATAAKAGFNTRTPMLLLPGDKPAAYFYEAKDGDALALFWNGYAMTLET